MINAKEARELAVGNSSGARVDLLDKVSKAINDVIAKGGTDTLFYPHVSTSPGVLNSVILELQSLGYKVTEESDVREGDSWIRIKW